MPTKNQTFSARVTDLTQQGLGVTRLDGYTVFVPHTAVGDEGEFLLTKAQKHYGYGRLLRLSRPSPDRVEPDCPVSGPCGGCLLRHISYEAELRWKQKLVANCFSRLGGIELPVSEILGSPLLEGYRNKAQYPVCAGADGKLTAGFYASRSHRVVPQTRCRLQPPEFGDILEWILSAGQDLGWSAYDERTGAGLLRHIYLRKGFRTDEMMACLVVSGNGRLPGETDFARRLTEAFPAIVSVLVNHNPNNTNVILGPSTRTIGGKDTMDDILCGVRFTLSPHSFYQINPAQTERLYQTALDLACLSDRDILLDLYCGAGTIGLAAAGRVAQVYGAEIVPQAVENARQNAAQNGISNARFLCADCSKAVRIFAEEDIRPSVIFIDPPRKGCTPDVLDAIAAFAPERVVMISCSPATAARDCSALEERGFRAAKIVPVDLFPRTGHCETVVLLSKGEIDSKKVRVEFSLEDMDMSGFQKGATYGEIKAYVKEQTGLSVSSLYIAQVKQKCGIIERENYNKPKSENAKHPQCPPEKEEAIRAALKHFQMI